MCHCVFKCYNKTPRIPINREQVLHINAHFCYKNCWFSQVFLGHALLCLLQNFPAAYTAGWTQTFQYNSSPQLNWVKVMWHSRALHYRQPPPSSNISCTASEVCFGVRENQTVVGNVPKRARCPQTFDGQNMITLRPTGRCHSKRNTALK